MQLLRRESCVWRYIYWSYLIEHCCIPSTAVQDDMKHCQSLWDDDWHRIKRYKDDDNGLLWRDWLGTNGGSEGITLRFACRSKVWSSWFHCNTYSSDYIFLFHLSAHTWFMTIITLLGEVCFWVTISITVHSSLGIILPHLIPAYMTI